MITDRELARYISSNLHLYLADEDKPVECKVVDVSKNNGGTVAGVQILMHGVDHGPVISMETIRGLLDIGMPREEVMKNIADYVEDKAELTKWIQLQQEADKKDNTISKSIDRISDRYDKSTALLMKNLENIRYKLNGDSVAMMVNAMEFSIRNLGDLTPDLKKLEQQPDRDECRNISDIFESINQSRISWLDKIQKYISDPTIVKKIDDIKTGITNDIEYEKRLFIRLESQIADTVEPDTIEQYDCKWSRERFVELDPPQDLYNLSRVKLTCLESNNPNYKKGDVLAFADSEYQLINPDYNISVRDLNRDFNDWVSETQPKFHTKGLTSNLNQVSVIDHSQEIDKG